MKSVAMNETLLTCNNSASTLPVPTAHHSLNSSLVIQIQYSIALCLGLVFLLGVTGNIFMLLVLIDNLKNTSSSPISTMTSTFMANVTISDMIFLLYNVPVMLLSFIFKEWELGSAVCISSQGMSMWTMFCSFYTMVATSMLRYLAVVHPQWNLSSSKRQRFALVTLMWLLSFLVSIPNWLNQEVVDIEGATYCVFCMTKAQTFLYFLLFGSIALLPAILLMVGCYWEIIRSLWFHHEKMLHVDSRIHKNRKVTFNITVIVVAFVVMWIPYWVLTCLSAFHRLPQRLIVFVISSLSTLLAYANCCVSPLLYFVLSDKFRFGLWKLFRGQQRNIQPRQMYWIETAVQAINRA
ncbi:galanin receptor type 2-like [Microcaecilia unicolor]|uniref:Galanin receptor type 2-like n=1 Tax=Microcaecilia unicolor TaxID=1415580 RepID=A0A6P7ZIW2_9AMPH|nr:galanin receptor type 2-like [Microcaecilia unicolor]